MAEETLLRPDPSRAVPRNLQNHERLLPNQPLINTLFQGDEEGYFPALAELTDKVCDWERFIADFEIETPTWASYETFGSSHSGLFFLDMVVRLMQPKRLIEIGTFVGLSAMVLARAAGPDAKVFTVEVGDEFAGIAQRNLDRNGYANVEILRTPIHEAEADLRKHGPFDFVSLDGGKEFYARYAELLLPHTAERCLLLVDDALFHGDVLNPQAQSEKGAGVQDLHRSLNAAYRWRSLLPVENGKLLALKG